MDLWYPWRMPEMDAPRAFSLSDRRSRGTKLWERDCQDVGSKLTNQQMAKFADPGSQHRTFGKSCCSYSSLLLVYS